MPALVDEQTPSRPDRRMGLIEALLLWEGGLTNERLRSLLHVSSVHASRLIGAYQTRFPAHIERAHGEGRGRYRAGRGIQPVLNDQDPQTYLNLVAGQRSAHIERVRCDYSACPPAIFGALHRAAATGRGVEVTYHSLTRPQGVTRLIFPHALVQLGTRWHARAYDSDRQAFRDFNIGRVSAYQPLDQQAPVTLADDTAWHTTVPVLVRAHQGLGPGQARVVEREYFGGSTGRRIETRGCLVHYLTQGLRAAVDPTIQRPPEYLLQIQNIEEIQGWLMSDTSIALD